VNRRIWNRIKVMRIRNTAQNSYRTSDTTLSVLRIQIFIRWNRN
jgi:hypothetical protein